MNRYALFVSAASVIAACSVGPPMSTGAATGVGGMVDGFPCNATTQCPAGTLCDVDASVCVLPTQCGGCIDQSAKPPVCVGGHDVALCGKSGAECARCHPDCRIPLCDTGVCAGATAPDGTACPGKGTCAGGICNMMCAPADHACTVGVGLACCVGSKCSPGSVCVVCSATGDECITDADCCAGVCSGNGTGGAAGNRTCSSS